VPKARATLRWGSTSSTTPFAERPLAVPKLTMVIHAGPASDPSGWVDLQRRASDDLSGVG
jgi:hypothetical protein